MAEPRQKLRAVPEAGAAADAAGDDPGREERWVRWILAALLAFAVAALIVQTWRARGLHDQVATLRGELSATRAELAAHQAHGIQVRDKVGELQSRLQAGMAELQELVEREPGGG